ncbi:MAG: hypothetical protein OXC83_11560 [Chloroflexi bacterium]|nr:hypothetical protein [Chloroflexota bacterium]
MLSITDTNGWMHAQNRSDGLIPRFGLLTSEIATIVGEDALSIRERIRAGSIPGYRLKELGFVVAYAMTFDDIAHHFALSRDQKFQLGTYPKRNLVPGINNEYKHRLTYTNDVFSYAPLRTEFSTLDELKTENPQTFIAEASESDWLD